MPGIPVSIVAHIRANRVSGSRPTRRTSDEMAALRLQIYQTLSEIQPASVRQTFYALTVRGIIPKTEAAYKRVVVRLLTRMRLAGEIPYGWLTDSSRWMRKPRTYSSLSDMLERTSEFYRRALWDSALANVEIWLEKEALSGVLYDVTSVYDVPLMVTRGYPSLTYLYEAAEALRQQSKPAYLYYFGDFDPSGVDISRHVEERLRQFASDAEINFVRVAVNQDQIASMRLPTRPTKKTDARAKNFAAESVEVDAIDPNTLRSMVQAAIMRHIDAEEIARLEVIEKAERQTLSGLAAAMRRTVKEKSPV
jgi:hypothetical protein